MLLDYDDALDVLCTLDVCRFAMDTPSNAYSHLKAKHPVNVKIGVDTDLLYADNNDGLKALYYFINANRAISFDFSSSAAAISLTTLSRRTTARGLVSFFKDSNAFCAFPS